MKSCHDVDSVINEESLGSIGECYSIQKEYVLRAPLPKQQPCNPESSKISISMDALEVGLCFPLHPTIVECLRWWRTSPSAMDLNSLHRKPRMPSGKNTSASRAENSQLEVEEIYMETTTKRPARSSAPE
ncbi:hypothetical protein BHM03_00044569 [Ensete ventricosum]|nr:hypothetical protein BHM03_00044569 [Ensete ventricosum]